ncbi:hypothetical protein BpHYR1_008018 [Brachionus plicatilis]|uniref:Uncharacterized protein n=1 Tax=Brachionus plicatilis TaxID=10195 RepID=A0A3M7R3N4_BRAPC|nr:hypothetical protein BpHYR1_008018 [Brachionus plicatilis]
MYTYKLKLLFRLADTSALDSSKFCFNYGLIRLKNRSSIASKFLRLNKNFKLDKALDAYS